MKYRVPGLIAILFMLSLLHFGLCRMEKAEIQTPNAINAEIVDYRPVVLLVKMGEGIRAIELERYLVGVVLAEMPAEFEPEALKAQAVVARTFAWKAHIKCGKHVQFDLCADPTCCQGYLSEKDYLSIAHDGKSILKIQDAVRSTAGVVITYEDEPIEATYFSCSGGYTENAEEVWGYTYPYLTAKKSPGEENAYCFRDEKTFSKEQLTMLLHLDYGDCNFQNWEYTKGGGVANVEIGNRNFSGTELRNVLGLRSTRFAVSCTDDQITFCTQGYGHRVGMSQYGADAMAVAGKTFEEILIYYYDGTILQKIEDLQEYI